MKYSRVLPAILAAAMALPTIRPTGVTADPMDKGSFTISRNGRVLGAETFQYDDGNDGLVVRARQYLTLPSSQGDEPFEKGLDLMVGRLDFALRRYQSNRNFRGVKTIRALELSDTHYVAYREVNGRGEGDSRVLPPGRLFVMDSQIVTAFDLLCRGLQGSPFQSRPINLLALGPSDTMLDARVVSLGPETIRWGGKPVVARKLQLVADSQTTFTLWAGPRGELLRLVEPVGGLRAEREPPPLRKRRPAPPPRPAPGPKPGG